MPVPSVTVNNNTGIKPKKEASTMDKAAAFVNMEDSQLKKIAQYCSYDKDEKKEQRSSLAKWFLAIPVVDTIAKGTLFGGDSLGGKARISARVAAGWAACLAAVGAYSAAKNAAMSKSENLKEFNQRHPVTSFVVDIGVILTGLTLGALGLGMFHQEYPKPGEKISESLSNMEKSLNKTNFNKNTMPKIMEAVKEADLKAPGLMNLGRLALDFSWLILLGVGILKSFNYEKADKKKADKNYRILKDQQSMVAKGMVKILNAKTDALEQKNKVLVDKLAEAKLKEKATEEAKEKVKETPKQKPVIKLRKLELAEKTIEAEQLCATNSKDVCFSEPKIKSKKVTIVYE